MTTEKKFATTLIENAIIDDEKKIIRGVIGSTGAIDRHNESVNPEGWDTKNFKKNPVILYAHDYWGLPIGKALKVYVEGKKLMFDIQFATHDFALKVFDLFKEKILNAFSVGFIVKKWGEDKDKYSIMEQELLELSVVPVPANQEALANMLHVKSLDDKTKKLLEDFKALLEKEVERMEAEKKALDEPREDEEPEVEEIEDEDEEEETEEKANEPKKDEPEAEEPEKTEEKEKVVAIKLAELKDILKEAFGEAVANYKIVEEKIVKEVEVKEDLEAKAKAKRNQEAFEFLTSVRQQMVKSKTHADEALKSMKELLSVTLEKGGE